MKKLFYLFLIFNVLFFLGACSIPSGNPDSQTDDTTVESNEGNEDALDKEGAEDNKDSLQEQLDNYTVYVTKTGSCYHRRNCSTLSRSKNIYSMTRKEAKTKGYSSCSKCKS